MSDYTDLPYEVAVGCQDYIRIGVAAHRANHTGDAGLRVGDLGALAGGAVIALAASGWYARGRWLR